MICINNIWKLPCFQKRTGLQKSFLKKSYEVAVGTQSYKYSLEAINRQFKWLEISLVYDKSNQQNLLYDNYNAELAVKILGKVKVKNITKSYSVSNEFDVTGKNQRHLIYK